MTSILGHDILYYICEYISARDIAALARADCAMNNILQPILVRKISVHKECGIYTVATHRITRLSYIDRITNHEVQISERSGDIIATMHTNQSTGVVATIDGHRYDIAVSDGSVRSAGYYINGYQYIITRACEPIKWTRFVDTLVYFHRTRDIAPCDGASPNVIFAYLREIISWIFDM